MADVKSSTDRVLRQILDELTSFHADSKQCCMEQKQLLNSIIDELGDIDSGIDEAIGKLDSINTGIGDINNTLDDIHEDLDDIVSQLHELTTDVDSIAVDVSNIDTNVEKLVSPPAISATLTLAIKGVREMPATIHVNGNGATATFTEFDQPGGTGNVVPPIGPVVFSSSDPTIATVDQSGQCAAVAAGTVTITALDQGNSLTASDTLTVTADVAVSATLTLQAN